jgi:hypothetical protein
MYSLFAGFQMSSLVGRTVEAGASMDKDGTDITTLPWTRHSGLGCLGHAIAAARTWECKEGTGSRRVD